MSILDIPKDIRSVILPESLSVTALLRYESLPGPCLLSADLERIEEWLSSSTPSDQFQPFHLFQIPLPPLPFVRRLHAAIVSDDPSTPQALHSISIKNLPTTNHCERPEHLPLWAVTYWQDAYNARCRVKARFSYRWYEVERYTVRASE